MIEKIAETTYSLNCIKELPEILVSEFLKQQTIESVFFFSFFLLVGMVSIVVLKQYEFLSSQAFFAAVFALFGSIFMICHNLNQLFQIFFTPNLYLLENIKELVAK